ncbi:amidase domain-containing protein [Bacillus sp. P14.5]|uniref:amidase domain-containing protein n=1 Tax=Bacillus sp. P14.5 TaxID=1983400 RepID=UPI000DE8AEF7|nr:amidase domain-containing protein [Bacillus sp. P14.5]
MRNQLKAVLEERILKFVEGEGSDKIQRKNELLRNRQGEIVKVEGTGKVEKMDEVENGSRVDYTVHLKYLIKQKGFLHIEEEIETREAFFYGGELVSDDELPVDYSQQVTPTINLRDQEEEESERVSYQYDRLKAVQYAEKWWNSYNPAYKKFEVDCTNFISQCLHAGNAPMRGYPSRGKGWWMRNNNWSFSWSVAHALRMYLPASNAGLKAREVNSPDELMLGDVICYDFEGDGRYNHNTIVTSKDAFGMPLVNAHTHNSRLRYWDYEDSTAYTPNIKYKFFTIEDNA